METIINNLLNGNVAEAKKAARRVTYANISLYLTRDLGWQSERAHNTALFLKELREWQAYCDEEHRLTAQPTAPVQDEIPPRS